MLKVKRIITGELDENCYILEKDGSCLIIDPGSDFEKIKKEIKLPLLAVLITHRHPDHIGALAEFVEKYKCPVYDKMTTDEDNYKVGPFSFNVIFNPGHTPDSITFYFPDKKVMFDGDFVFEGNIGRCDLEGGDKKEMLKSIEKLKRFPDDVTLYPGHGEFTKLGHEKLKNYYFNI
jgi:glyoxylase-like metal-dependent hydrolase (beta-lactamase superfamily II)